MGVAETVVCVGKRKPVTKGPVFQIASPFVKTRNAGTTDAETPAEHVEMKRPVMKGFAKKSAFPTVKTRNAVPMDAGETVGPALVFWCAKKASVSPWGVLPNATGKPAEPMDVAIPVVPAKVAPFAPWLGNVWEEVVLPIVQVFNAVVMGAEALVENAPETSRAKKGYVSIPCNRIAVRSV